MELIEQQALESSKVIKNGGIILYPTDTVWGLGCDATNQAAVERIFKLKERNDKKSMILLMKSVDEVSRYIQKIPQVAADMLEISTSPLTLILPGGVGVAPNLIHDDGTIALRIPDNDFCQKLLYKLRCPIVSTSANISGEATPKRFDEISQDIIDGVDFVVDADLEGQSSGKPSSIIKVGMGGEIEILRQ